MENRKSKKEIAHMLLNQNLEEKDEAEIIDLLVDSPLAVDVDKETNLTFGEKMADKISAAVGSWTFILLFLFFLVAWIILNAYFLINPVDPYPFILLNLVLSCVAAIQAPIIMMSQNRQSKKDSLRGHNDYRIDLKSELIIEALHDDIEMIKKNQNKILKYIDSQNKENNDSE